MRSAIFLHVFVGEILPTSIVESINAHAPLLWRSLILVQCLLMICVCGWLWSPLWNSVCPTGTPLSSTDNSSYLKFQDGKFSNVSNMLTCYTGNFMFLCFALCSELVYIYLVVAFKTIIIKKHSTGRLWNTNKWQHCIGAWWMKGWLSRLLYWSSFAGESSAVLHWLRFASWSCILCRSMKRLDLPAYSQSLRCAGALWN